MVMQTKSPQGARLNPQNTLELSQGMSIQVAIDTANAHGGEWTILLYPGAPYREGDITHVGVANITIKSMGPERVSIAPTVAPAAGVIICGAILTLDGVDVIAPTAAFPALRVEGGTCTCLNHCEFRFVGAGGDSIQMVNGILTMYDCLVLTGDIDLSTNACTLNMYYCRINADPIDTAGALIHNITLVECDFNGQNINSAATGATVITIRGCSNIGALTHAGTGAVTIRDSEVASINMTAAGTVVAYGGYIGAITRAAGSVVWWLDGETIKVLPSATITDGMIGYALAAAAAAGITIRLAAGRYQEDNLALVDGVTIVGEGHETIEIYEDSANPILTAGANVVCRLRALKIHQDGAGECLQITGAGAEIHCDSIDFDSAGTHALEMTNGSFSSHLSDFQDGDIYLATNACTLTLDYCRIAAASGIDTDAAAVGHTISCEYCDFNGSSISIDSTGAGSTVTLTLRFCSDILAISDASLLGTVYIEHNHVGTATKTGTSTWTIDDTHISTALLNSNATGDITVYGGVIFAVTDSTGSIVWYSNEDKTLEVIVGMKIAHALAAAGANSIIKIGPGTYAENNLQLIANVDLVGEDPEECQIVADSAAQPILKAVSNVTISNLTIGNTNAGNAAIQVNPGNTIVVRSCEIYGTAGGECLDLRGGSIHAHETHFSVGVIHCDTQDCTVSLYKCEVTVAFNTSAARAHVLTFDHCDFGGNNLASGATGATTLSMRGCSNVGTVSNAGTGTFTIIDSGVDTVTATSTGPFIITGGRVLACGGATASITWKTHAQQYEVIAGMVIGHAITAAAADTPTPADTDPYTILIHPGIYDEEITMSDWVSLKGIGPKGNVVIYRATTDIINLADHVELQNLTLRLNGNVVFLVRDNGVAYTARFTDLVLEVVVPAAWAFNCFWFHAAGDYTIERCFANIAGTGGVSFIRNTNGAATVRLVNNDFTLANANGSMINTNMAGVWTGKGNRFAGTCAMFLANSGTFTFDNNALLCTGGWTVTAARITLRHCVIEAPVVAGTTAVVRMKNCSYRAISRAGTGNIVDESPDLKDAPWHIERWTWQAALANSQVAVRGVPLDAGSGQVIIETLDSGAGVMAVETSPELARALGNEFIPARTPRFLTQISAYTDDGSGAGNPAFDPHVAMFFGLRHTLGPALPAHPEHHAGFIWTGAAFNASSNDGAATQTTALTTPSDDAQHQLEVIVFGGVTTIGRVEFYVDGVLVATHVTRIPVDTLDWQHLIIGLGTGTGDTISVTVRPGGCQECPA